MSDSSRYVVSGIHAVEAVVKSRPETVARVLFAAGNKNRRLENLKQMVRSASIAFVTLDAAELEARVKAGRHQGVVAELKPGSAGKRISLVEILAANDNPFILILDGIQDPHNLGACLRSADAAGVDAVVIPKRGGVGITDVVRRVSVGAAESVPVISVSNLARTIEDLKNAGVWIWGASEQADVQHWDAELTGPLGLVLGAEGDGMRSLTERSCDALLRIPMAGEVPSLNVSVSAGVVLFEAVRQRTAGQRQRTPRIDPKQRQ